MSTRDDVLAFMRMAQAPYVRRTPVAPEGDDPALSRAADDLHAWKDALPGSSATHLGARLMLEELGETLRAMAEGDVVALADGLADLVYVAHWTAHAHGIDLDAVLAEVHRANMTKFPTCAACDGSGAEPTWDGQRTTGNLCGACGGLGRVAIRDVNGKVQKPPGWTPPDVAGVLARQRPIGVRAEGDDDRSFAAEHAMHAAVARSMSRPEKE